MKRLIIAQIKIEIDDTVSDYGAANMKTPWDIIVADHLVTTARAIRAYCSIQIDETKDSGEKF